VVDDDPGSAAAVADLLRARGYEVVVALDYQPALAELEGTGPLDVLVTDIVMPQRVNGLALSRMARMRRPGLPVVYMTGYDIPGVADEALGPILRKPIDDNELIAEIERAVSAP
jgi:CheY-like chemotaxis protein